MSDTTLTSITSTGTSTKASFLTPTQFQLVYISIVGTVFQVIVFLILAATGNAATTTPFKFDFWLVCTILIFLILTFGSNCVYYKLFG